LAHDGDLLGWGEVEPRRQVGLALLTRDSIRIIVSTDVTATPSRGFGHDVHRITRAETSTALFVPRVSSGVGTFVAWLERLLRDPQSRWVDLRAVHPSELPGSVTRLAAGR
jgi:hypothetical protein